MSFCSKSEISVVIPLYNGRKTFSRCLDALEACVPPPHEIIVVADGPSDGSWRLSRDRGYQTIVLDSQKGPAHARNVGAAQATGDVLLFIDSDVTVKADIIARIGEIFSLEPSISAVIGSYDDEPSGRGLISQYRNLLHHFTHQHGREDAATFWGACGAVRRLTFLGVGGFDEDYTTASIEDIEFGSRLKKQGYRIRLVKNLQVKHLKEWGLGSMVKTDVFKRAIPWSRLIIASGEINDDLNLRLINRISAIAAIALLFSPLTWRLGAGLPFTLLFGLIFVVTNIHFYAFLIQKKSLLFLLQVIPLHWFYYIYSSLSYASVKIHAVVSPKSVSLDSSG